MVQYRPSDYCSGKILQKGKVVASISGSYLGFLDIDGNRFWDGRYMSPFRVEFE